MKKYLFYAVSYILIYLSIELVAAGGLFLLKKIRLLEYHPLLTTSLSPEHRQTLQDLIAGKTTYLLHSPALGWTIKPQGYWGSLYRANSQGVRADKDYKPYPDSKIVRIATFGDSFTHGEEVKNEYTWQEQLIRLCPQIEVINFGVGGYGLDQSFLRYENEGKLYHPHIVLIGFMQENINRSVNVFRPFYVEGLPLTKPRFIVEDDALILLPNPMPALAAYKKLLNNPEPFLSQFGQNDFHFSVRVRASFLDFSPSVRMIKLIYQKLYNRYLIYSDSAIYKNGCFNPKGEAFVIIKKLFDQFYAEAQHNESLPIIVLFPCRVDMEQYLKNNTKICEPLVNYFKLQNFRYIDLFDAFKKYAQSVPLKDLFMQEHYSPLGNSIVARGLLDYLSENRLIKTPVIQSPIPTKQGMIQRAQQKKP